jgi:hypothetical protein
MAAGNFLSARADQQVLHRFRRLEEAHIDKIPEGEREEIRQIFRGKGFGGEMLEQVVQVITEDRQRWVNTMLTEEWGLQLMPPSPWKAALATLSAFVLAGLVPLSPILVRLDRRADESFAVSALLTGVTFFLIGVVRGRVADHRPLASGVETLFIGSSRFLSGGFSTGSRRCNGQKLMDSSTSFLLPKPSSECRDDYCPSLLPCFRTWMQGPTSGFDWRHKVGRLDRQNIAVAAG